MYPFSTLHGMLIKTISTKFFHKADHLCYQIVVQYDGDVYLAKEFESYDDYSSTHSALVDALNTGADYQNTFLQVNPIHRMAS